ncbi:MAG: hypothetical protein UD936_08440, partial [Acutalibacteraceae bacterium]|nr:hypothetical protein [Acutalibacteraceae bacterium]
VVAEGRRSINNIQRSASLFLVKTVFSTLLSVIFVFCGALYPFMPIQMTLINAFCIGFPSFVLALEPNENKIEGNFLLNIFKRAIPGGVTVALSVVLVTVLGNMFDFSDDFISTLAVAVTAFVGLMVVYKTSLPFNSVRTIMFAISVGGMVWGVAYSKHFFCDILKTGNIFGFVNMSFEFLVCLAVCAGFSFLLFLMFNLIVVKVNIVKRKKK